MLKIEINVLKSNIYGSTDQDRKEILTDPQHVFSWAHKCVLYLSFYFYSCLLPLCDCFLEFFLLFRFGAGTKIAENFYARQDGTRTYFFTVPELGTVFFSLLHVMRSCVPFRTLRCTVGFFLSSEIMLLGTSTLGTL
jgi:hypothetical protein